MGIFDFLWGSGTKMSAGVREDKVVAQRINKNMIYYSASVTEATSLTPPPANPSSSSSSSSQSPSTSSPSSLPETTSSHTDLPPSSALEPTVHSPSDSPSDSPILPSSPLLPPSSPPSLPLLPLSSTPSRPLLPPPRPRLPPSSHPSRPLLPPSSPPSHPLLPPRSPSSPHSRPLLLLFPWLGAKPAGIAKYRDLYLGRGVDVLVVESSVWLFLWPRWGLEYGAEVLQVLGDPRFTQRPLLVHAFSIGGFTFTQLLVHMTQRPGEFSDLARRVKGQVYDSMVVGSLEQMATGLGKTLFPQIESVVKRLALGYFWLFKPHTADIYLSCIQVFYNNPVTSPALFFFCENDRLCSPVAMDELIDHWKKRGVVVETGRWKESVHVRHLRCHPQEYLSMLETFVDGLSLVPLKAKM